MYVNRSRCDPSWDFGYLGTPELDVDLLLGNLVTVIGASVRGRALRAAGVSAIDRELLAERAMAIDRHLERVAARLPQSAADLLPATDPSDAVILHLWQATQIVIDLAMAACLALKLGTPSSYGEAFRRLQSRGVIDAALADRLVRAAGFCNVIAHAYDTLDMRRVHAAAATGPADLRTFLARLPDAIGQ